jgi:predicted negative regulator of RcsB-dependent stress response
MAVYDLEEQEQLAELKAWWKQHGNWVTAIVVAVALAVVGWQAWNWWVRSQSVQAASLYVTLERVASLHDTKKASEVAGEIIDKFPRTSYAALAALLSAKVNADAGDAKTAKLQLAWAAEHGREAELRDLARLRLAIVLLDDKAYAEAAKQLSDAPIVSYAARYAEVKGDIFMAQSKRAEARAAYQEALKRLDEAAKTAGEQSSGLYRDVLQIKLESTGVNS